MTNTHPACRFNAPSSIQAGVPIKTLIDLPLIRLIAESFTPLLPRFDAPAFIRDATTGLQPLGIMARGSHVARALAAQLPPKFPDAAQLLIASLGPPLPRCEQNGMAPFFYLPHTCLIAHLGPTHFPSAMQACHALTQRFTAEFCIRPIIAKHQSQALKLLKKWTRDDSPHVRRLVSEGTRPRLPWASRLQALQADPTLALPLLEALKDDPEQYVRRSVANHLADILKDHPDLAYATCHRWAKEAQSLPPTTATPRKWILRHAVRHPAKKGNKQALEIRLLAAIGTSRE